MIEVKNVRKSFAGREVLKGISHVFEKGKTNLIIGQSGSGKTVLLKSIIGLHTIDQGTVIFDGRIFSKISNAEKKEIRQEIGMVFQGGALFDSLTVLENVLFPLQMFADMTKAEMLKRAHFCLDRVNLVGADTLYPAEASGGMQKRTAIARAIALNPKYLFCDEPNSGLDPITAIVIDKLIREITIDYNITTVINTHDMNSVMEIGDTVAFIYKGEKWWTGNRTEIINSDNKELNEFVFAGELMKKVRANSVD
jgi:phospholipid/cholesterol/gamma-HCH transport system ATP-binding protein